MARPTNYCPTTAAKIISAVHAGETIEAACRRVGVKRTTFLSQIERYNFRAVLDQAKAAGRAANSETATVRGPSIGPQNEPATPVRRHGSAQVSAHAEVRGECTWSANEPALAIIVNIVGAVLDGLRSELRSRGHYL